MQQQMPRQCPRITRQERSIMTSDYRVSPIKKVPISDVKIAQKTRMPGRDLRTSENQATIIVGERNCSTVAVAAFDFSMVSKKSELYG